MVFNAKVAGDTLREPFTFYVIVGILFLMITAISELGLKWLESRYNKHEKAVSH